MASTITAYDHLWKLLLTGAVDLDTDTLKLALVTSSYTPSTTHDEWADVSANEVATGSGYTTGQTLDVTGFAGQYGHTMFGAGSSSGLGQYAVALDGLTYTFLPPVSYVPRRITPVRLGPRLLPIGVI
jgi:hypothetical protein